MNDLVLTSGPLDDIYRFQEESMKQEQVLAETTHTFHAGMYARTIYLPPGVALTGVLIKIETIVIFNGDAFVYSGGESVRMTGYTVLKGSANRKQIFVTMADTTITMLFPTSATTVEEAEKQFTDEYDMLLTNRLGNKECQEQLQLQP